MSDKTGKTLVAWGASTVSGGRRTTTVSTVAGTGGRIVPVQRSGK